jgi:hypothetical protein
MFTPAPLNFNESSLFERYCKFKGIPNWQSLKKEECMELGFKSTQFWRQRAKELNASTVTQLLSGTPLDGTKWF